MSNQETSSTSDAQQPASPAPETMPSLEEMLQEAERKAQEHYDAWMYAKAETENIRKRSYEEADKARKFAVESFSSELLAVKDALEMALAVETATLDSLKSGVDLTLKQLVSVFAKFNIQEINPVGEKFDPHKHQAMSMVEAEAEPNTIVSVMQKGYLLNDRVLRPALVSVAKAKTG